MGTPEINEVPGRPAVMLLPLDGIRVKDHALDGWDPRMRGGADKGIGRNAHQPGPKQNPKLTGHDGTKPRRGPSRRRQAALKAAIKTAPK